MDTTFLGNLDVSHMGQLDSSAIPAGKRIGVAEFHRLAISHRRMIREDYPKAGLRGLRDEDTGERFFVDAHRLLAK